MMRVTLGFTMFAWIMTVAGSNISAWGEPGLISLGDSLEPLKKAFNAESAIPRVVAILSPT